MLATARTPQQKTQGTQTIDFCLEKEAYKNTLNEMCGFPLLKSHKYSLAGLNSHFQNEQRFFFNK